MTADEMERLGISPCAYRFEGSRDLRVEWRGTGLWAVVEGGCCLNKSGEMEYEPRPSSRDQAFFDKCRFPLDEALRLAAQHIKPI